MKLLPPPWLKVLHVPFGPATIRGRVWRLTSADALKLLLDHALTTWTSGGALELSHLALAEIIDERGVGRQLYVAEHAVKIGLDYEFHPWRAEGASQMEYNMELSLDGWREATAGILIERIS